MASRFLFNQALWHELGSRIPKAKSVRAAVAYLGAGASRLLPLRKGDALVVDMSLRAVRSGTTDPREVRTFLQKGVAVFSRESLHAKFFVIDDVTIAGSSNISSRARHALDEAAILTNDPATRRRASAILDDLCTEPVRKEYLRKCLDEYRPPRFPAGGATPPSRKPIQGKVWIIGGLEYYDLPDREEKASDEIVERATKRLRDFERCEVDYSHYPTRPKFFERLRPGDWLVICIADGNGFDVYPPARFLGVQDYARGKGKRRYLLLQERPTGGKTVRWARFRSSARRSVKLPPKPRTGPIVNAADADAVLRLWNVRGKFVGRAP